MQACLLQQQQWPAAVRCRCRALVLRPSPAAAAAAAVAFGAPPGTARGCSCASRRRTEVSQGPIVDKEFEVPQVGWMWDTSAPSGKAGTTARALKSAKIKAKKSLGQNFCTDDTTLASIVAAARVSPADAVIEVGPGTGNLTVHLLATQAQVLAVEKDDTLFARLGEEFKQATNLQLVHGDVMRLELQQLVQQVTAAASHAAQQQGDSADGNGQLQQPAPPHQGAAAAGVPASDSSSSSSSSVSKRRRVKVVANLPYNITKDFLVAMLPQGELISELSIMIQEEVAQRLVDATPGRSNYRAMSVFTHFYSKPVYRFRIPKEQYFPVPGVDGALVTFKLLPPGKRRPVPGERGFISMVKQAFSERRKMLRNTLQPLYTAPQIETALQAVGMRRDARAQDLSTEQFCELYRQLHAAVTAELEV